MNNKKKSCNYTRLRVQDSTGRKEGRRKGEGRKMDG